MLANASLHSNERVALRESLASLYGVVEVDVHVNGAPFGLLKVRDTNKLVDAITPHEFSDDERLPYWAEVWPSSIVLAQFVLTRFDVKNKRVLELGRGLGLAVIAAARRGAFVTFSDYENQSLEFSRFNAQTNLDHEQFARAEFRHLDWRAGNSLCSSPSMSWLWIVHRIRRSRTGKTSRSCRR